MRVDDEWLDESDGDEGNENGDSVEETGTVEDEGKVRTGTNSAALVYLE